MRDKLTFTHVNGDKYRPVKQTNQKTGVTAYRLKGASNKTEDSIPLDSIEEVARAMLINQMPVRVQAFDGGIPSYFKYGRKLISYDLEADIANNLGIPRTGSLSPPAVQVRQYVIDAYIKPARNLGDKYVEFISGDIHREMSLKDALPIVCVVLESRDFAELANVRLIERNNNQGNDNPSSTVRYKFLLEPTSGSDMTDEELLQRFDGCEDFKKRRGRWNDMQSSAFCLIARAVHDMGLDWYHTKIPQARFGRREKSKSKAKPTFGIANIKSSTTIEFSHSFDGIDSLSVHALNHEGAQAFINKLNDAKEAILEKLPEENFRAGYWPNDYRAAALDDNESEEIPMKKATNLILYGPPGTGKTYQTMEHAVKLCGEEPKIHRQELREQYERLINAKQIEFVTFHQNFAYEEFVEGMRPQTGNGAGFTLEAEAGIFRNLCTIADAARKSASSGQSFSLENRQVFKMSLGRAGFEDEIFEDAKENDYITLGWGGDIDWHGYDSYEAIHERWNQDFPNTHGSDSNIAQVSRFVVDMKAGDLVIITYGNKKIRAIAEIVGNYEYNPTGFTDYNHRRSVKWLKHFDDLIDASVISRVNFSQKSCYLINKDNINREGLSTLLPNNIEDSKTPKQFVLIIDEINRANVSKVFGELITLIESDKRLGADNELTVQLPYSKKKFGVPSNLHIIGTMNTADRSIAQLDSALRRRFTFKELAPDTTVAAFIDAENDTGIKLSDVLNSINERIEYLIDRDHRIGHAFFIGCKNKENVDAAMRDKIIPLLQEYFFDDWNRMAAVLGERDKGGNFLEMREIKDPMGEGDTRESWSVKKSFHDVDYERVINGSSGANTSRDETTNS